MNSGISGAYPATAGHHFPDPFLDYASMAMPRSMPHALRYCEAMAMANGLYRQAVKRVLSYFITEPDVSHVDDAEQGQWADFLEHTLGLRSVLQTTGMDLQIYGNSFVSVLPSFRRYLACPTCACEVPLAEAHDAAVFRFQWSAFQFMVTCPRCAKRAAWKRIDREDTRPEAVRVKRWSPHEIELLHDPYSDQVAYLWRIPEDYRRQVRVGRLFHLERVRWEVVEAIRDDKHLMFDSDVIFHAKEEALAGFRNAGWGLSPMLANFRQGWYVQVLHRYNEAIAMDYVIPFRLITPAPGAGGGQHADPLRTMNMSGFTGTVRGMLANRRRDPAAWNTLPFPVQYQALGGDAKQLAPKELLDQGQETLLNSIGVPVELFKGTLQVQAAPAALRLFEATWNAVPASYNNLLQFIVRRVSQILSWEPATVSMTRVTHADDLQRQQTKLQLMGSGQVSQTTGLKSVGLDYRDEVQRNMDDQRFMAEEQAKVQGQMEQAAQMSQLSSQPQGGAPPAGAAPGGDPAAAGTPQADAAQGLAAQLPTGPNQAITPEELLSRAQYMASQLLGMPESQKDSELIRLKRMDPTLHAQVRMRMDDMRQQMRTQGGAMLQAQQFGKQGSVTPRGGRRPRSLLDGVTVD
jgi:hypothetical protein